MMIAVLGASGRTGGAVAERLLSAKVKVRALGRSRERLGPLVRRGAEAVETDLADLAAALRGADGLYAMLPEDYTSPDLIAELQREAEQITAAVRDSGVKRLVFLSSLGAELPSGTGPIVGLHRAEKLLESLPGDRLIIRAAYFYENFLESVVPIKQTGRHGDIVAPDVPVAMIEPRDVGVMAADALATGDFKGLSVREVCGPHDLTMTQATRILGAAVGKPELPYVQLPEADYLAGLTGAGLSPSTARLMAEMGKAIGERLIHPHQPRTPRTTGPTAFERFAEDFAQAYRTA